MKVRRGLSLWVVCKERVRKRGMKSAGLEEIDELGQCDRAVSPLVVQGNMDFGVEVEPAAGQPDARDATASSHLLHV